MSVANVGGTAAVLALCTIALTVFGALLYSTFAHSPSNRNRVRECGWTLIPILIVIAAALPSLQSAPERVQVAQTAASCAVPHSYAAASLTRTCQR